MAQAIGDRCDRDHTTRPEPLPRLFGALGRKRRESLIAKAIKSRRMARENKARASGPANPSKP
jgi:hypothetical protein